MTDQTTRNAQPIFIHGLCRSGTTYIFSRFRKNAEYHVYYEPLNGNLSKLSRLGESDLARDRETQARKRHPRLDRPYFDEYPVKADGGVPEFNVRFEYLDFLLDDPPGIEAPALERYLQGLIQHAESKPKRPVLQFCYTSLRMEWLKRKFDPINIYLLRSARDLWASQRRDSASHAARDLIIAARNRESRWFKPLFNVLDIPAPQDTDPSGELRFFFRLRATLSPQDEYLLSYYMWLLTFLRALVTCEFILDLDLLSADPEARIRLEQALVQRGIEVDFQECRMPIYSKFALNYSEMETVEERVRKLLAHELSSVTLGSAHREFLGARYLGLLSEKWSG